ncbi:MAG: hypothetical protein JW807_13030 [Spirochaetes bacterium]|nr:hypothetical protein [Spirochaetota bacterium]
MNTTESITAKERILDFAGGLFDRMFLLPGKIANLVKPLRRTTREDFEREIDFYIDSGFIDRPESYFTFPEKAPSHAIVDRKPYYDGEYQLISYASGYTTRNPLLRDRYHAYASNRTGYLVRWAHGDPGRKTVLCHHGYMLGEPRQARKMFRVRNMFKEGLDVVLFIAPFHWKRGTGQVKQRGIYLQPDNPAMTCECVGQTMWDLYNSFMILRKLGATEIGIIGASLGGHNTALFVSLTAIPSFGAIMVPAVQFTDPLDPDRVRLPFPADARLREKMRLVWDLHSPLKFRPKIPVGNILVVASRGDRLCPFPLVQALCGKWGITNRLFLTGGHWLVFDRGLRGRAWYDFLRERGFLGLEPPKSPNGGLE